MRGLRWPRGGGGGGRWRGRLGAPRLLLPLWRRAPPARRCRRLATPGARALPSPGARRRRSERAASWRRRRPDPPSRCLSSPLLLTPLPAAAHIACVVAFKPCVFVSRRRLAPPPPPSSRRRRPRPPAATDPHPSALASFYRAAPAPLSTRLHPGPSTRRRRRRRRRAAARPAPAAPRVAARSAAAAAAPRARRRGHARRRRSEWMQQSLLLLLFFTVLYKFSISALELQRPNPEAKWPGATTAGSWFPARDLGGRRQSARRTPTLRN
jgi:hypothetical protein